MIYDSVPLAIEAEQYDGTQSSLAAIRDMLSRQLPAGTVTLIGVPPYLRRGKLPDEPLLPGNWVTMDESGWITHMSDAAFVRRFRARA